MFEKELLCGDTIIIHGALYLYVWLDLYYYCYSRLKLNLGSRFDAAPILSRFVFVIFFSCVVVQLGT